MPGTGGGVHPGRRGHAGGPAADRHRPGDIAVVSGTTSPVVTEMDRLFYDPGQRVWTDAGLGAENYQVEMNPGVTGLNYQRIRESLYRDWTYGQLEEAYEKKTSFACTASFSSLLFYQRRSLRRGGFFMGAPLGPSWTGWI